MEQVESNPFAGICRRTSILSEMAVDWLLLARSSHTDAHVSFCQCWP